MKLQQALRLVKYIKGKCGDSAKTRQLNTDVKKILGKDVEKWTFLRSGLDEAITNVSHHAYPNDCGIDDSHKNWYLTASYNNDKKILKVVFFDQGVGIPKTLPASDVWERVLSWLSKYSTRYAEGRSHANLLKAAVEIDRTSTAETDRGKGLQDLLEFIKQRKDGYISIISLKGLYKFSVVQGKETTKSVVFDRELKGTLIIWSVQL